MPAIPRSIPLRKLLSLHKANDVAGALALVERHGNTESNVSQTEAAILKPRRKLKQSAKARKAAAMKGKIKVSTEHGW